MPEKQSEVSLLAKIAGYTEILSKDPKSTVFVPLAETYRQMGLLDDALEIVRQGLRALPRFSPGYTALGRIHAQRGDIQQGIAALEKALEIDGDSLIALKSLARVLMRKGQAKRARELVTHAAALSPDDPAIKKMHEALGVASEAPIEPVQPPVPETGQQLDDELDDGPVDPITTATIADIYIKQGFPRRALKVYRDLLKADPHNSEIRGRLVALKKQIESEEAAAEALEAQAAADIFQRFPEIGSVKEELTMAKPASEPIAEKPDQARVARAQIAILTRWLGSIRKGRAHV